MRCNLLCKHSNDDLFMCENVMFSCEDSLWYFSSVYLINDFTTGKSYQTSQSTRTGSMQLIMLQSGTWNKFPGTFTLMTSGYRWMQSFGVKSITDITHLKRFALFS